LSFAILIFLAVAGLVAAVGIAGAIVWGTLRRQNRRAG